MSAVATIPSELSPQSPIICVNTVMYSVRGQSVVVVHMQSGLGDPLQRYGHLKISRVIDWLVGRHYSYFLY